MRPGPRGVGGDGGVAVAVTVAGHGQRGQDAAHVLVVGHVLHQHGQLVDALAAQGLVGELHPRAVLVDPHDVLAQADLVERQVGAFRDAAHGGGPVHPVDLGGLVAVGIDADGQRHQVVDGDGVRGVRQALVDRRAHVQRVEGVARDTRAAGHGQVAGCRR